MPYTSKVSEYLVIKKLENSCSDLFKWFRENHLKTYPNKCHLLLTSTSKHIKTNIECSYINSNEEKLLRINVDFQLSFESHVYHLSAKKLVKSYKMSYERCLMKVVLVKRRLMKAFAGNNLESKGSIWKNKKGHFVWLQILRLRFKKWLRGRAASDYRMLISSGLFPALWHHSLCILPGCFIAGNSTIAIIVCIHEKALRNY